MKLTVLLAAAATSMSLAAPAVANWQYTKFGMTAQQVIQASGGAARSGGGAQSVQQDGTTNDVVGSFDAGGRPFDVKFYFRSGLLDTVVLESSDGQACAQTARDLQAVYGSPIEATDNRAAGSATWLDTRKANRVKLVMAGGVYCEVQYTALASASAAGL